MRAGKLNAMPVLAFDCLLWICEVRAPRLAAYDLFAPSRPFIPIDRSYYTRELVKCQKSCVIRHPSSVTRHPPVIYHLAFAVQHSLTCDA